MTEGPELREMVASIIPEGRMPYIDARIALGNMSGLQLEDYRVHVARAAIGEAVEADINQEFEPPLSTPLSNVLHSLHATRDRWTRHEYVSSFTEKKFVVDGDAVSAAELMLAAIVDHGYRETFTQADATNMKNRLEVEMEGHRF